MNVEHIFTMSPCPRGTHTTFSGQEDGGWVVEIDASSKGDVAPQRIRILFQGVVQARLNSNDDRSNAAERVLSVQSSSSWLNEFERLYVEEYGPALVAVIKNVKHYVVHGHDISIGLLARKIVCESV